MFLPHREGISRDISKYGPDAPNMQYEQQFGPGLRRRLRISVKPETDEHGDNKSAVARRRRWRSCRTVHHWQLQVEVARLFRFLEFSVVFP